MELNQETLKKAYNYLSKDPCLDHLINKFSSSIDIFERFNENYPLALAYLIIEQQVSFKAAIKSTIKSISNKDDIEISFGGQDVSSEDNKLRLPEINEFQNRINFDLTRAQADSESLRLRYCNKKVLKNFEPAGSKAKRLYEIAEKIRYESLGAQEYKGIKDIRND